MFRLKSSEEI